MYAVEIMGKWKEGEMQVKRDGRMEGQTDRQSHVDRTVL
jgi:hypothetical protein